MRYVRQLLWLLSMVYLTGCANAALPVKPFYLGLSVSVSDSNQILNSAKNVGANSIRLDVPWRDIEKTSGSLSMPRAIDQRVAMALSLGMEPVLILAYGNSLYDGGDKPRSQAAIAAYARYAAYVTDYFKTKARFVELWNEWDAQTGSTSRATPEEYVALIRAAYPRVKQVNPAVVVLSGGISDDGLQKGFIDAFIQAGGLNYVDAVSLHPYNFFHTSGTGPEDLVSYLDSIEAKLRGASGSDVPIYITEVGWPNYQGTYGVTPQVTSWYLPRFILLAASRPYIKGVWWYCARDQGASLTNKEHNFGIYTWDLALKPAANTFAGLASLMKTATSFSSTQSGNKYTVTLKDATQKKIADVIWFSESIANPTYVAGKTPTPISKVTTVPGATSTTTMSLTASLPNSQEPMVVR